MIKKNSNDSQFAIVKLVAERISQEMPALATDDYTTFPEPLRWSMHGGPGTGQTHVIHITKESLFEEVSKSDVGVNCLIVALQAVMADFFSGDTIHHALSIRIWGKKDAKSSGDRSDMATMNYVLQLRWAIMTLNRLQ